jgi:hypothetical protein
LKVSAPSIQWAGECPKHASGLTLTTIYFFFSLSLNLEFCASPIKKSHQPLQFISPSHLVIFLLITIFLFWISHEITNILQFQPLLFLDLSDLVLILFIVIFLFLISYKITIIFQFHPLSFFLSNLVSILLIVIYFVWFYFLDFLFYNFILHEFFFLPNLISIVFIVIFFSLASFLNWYFFLRFHPLQLNWLEIKLLNWTLFKDFISYEF